MKVYSTDEVGMEVVEIEVPDGMAASSPKYRAVYKEGTKSMRKGDKALPFSSQTFDDMQFAGMVEGYIIGAGEKLGVEWSVDDEEYPANRVVSRLHDGTVVQEARFGRDKKWVMAFNREHPEYAQAVVEKWLDALQEVS